MILPDVNVLVHAHRRDTEAHERYADWLARAMAGTEELALTEMTLTGFLRIVTNARIFTDPATLGQAMTFVDGLRRGPRTRWLTAGTAVWTTLTEIAGTDPQVRGNLVPDAWLAALARAHGSRLATADRGFARFAGLDWFDPVRA